MGAEQLVESVLMVGSEAMGYWESMGAVEAVELV